MERRYGNERGSGGGGGGGHALSEGYSVQPPRGTCCAPKQWCLYWSVAGAGIARKRRRRHLAPVFVFRVPCRPSLKSKLLQAHFRIYSTDFLPPSLSPPPFLSLSLPHVSFYLYPSLPLSLPLSLSLPLPLSRSLFLVPTSLSRWLTCSSLFRHLSRARMFVV